MREATFELNHGIKISETGGGNSIPRESLTTFQEIKAFFKHFIKLWIIYILSMWNYIEGKSFQLTLGPIATLLHMYICRSVLLFLVISIALIKNISILDGITVTLRYNTPCHSKGDSCYHVLCLGWTSESVHLGRSSSQRLQDPFKFVILTVIVRPTWCAPKKIVVMRLNFTYFWLHLILCTVCKVNWLRSRFFVWRSISNLISSTVHNYIHAYVNSYVQNTNLHTCIYASEL